MMTSNGPPTPKGVGGPSPSLVSRGSEEGWEMEIPTMGFPSREGGGGSGPPPTQGGGKAPAAGRRRGPTLGRGRDDEPPSIQQGPRDHPLTHVDRKEPSLTLKDGGQDEGGGTDN